MLAASWPYANPVSSIDSRRSPLFPVQPNAQHPDFSMIRSDETASKCADISRHSRPSRTTVVQKKIEGAAKRRREAATKKLEDRRRSHREHRRGDDEMMHFMWISEQRQWEAEQARLAEAAAARSNLEQDEIDEEYGLRDDGLPELEDVMKEEDEDLQALVEIFQSSPPTVDPNAATATHQVDDDYYPQLWSDGDFDNLVPDGAPSLDESMDETGC